MVIALGDGNGVFHRLGDDGAAEEIADDIAVSGRAGDKRVGHADIARLLIRHAVEVHGSDGIERQECRAAGIAPAQQLDGLCAAALRLDDDVLRRRAERRLNGEGVAVAGLDEVCHRAAHAAQRPLFGRVHDGLDCAVVALKVFFHLGEHTDARFGAAQVDRQPGQPLLLLCQHLLTGGKMLCFFSLLRAQRVTGGLCLLLRGLFFLRLRLERGQTLGRLRSGGDDGVFLIEQLLRFVGQERDARAALGQCAALRALSGKQLRIRALGLAGGCGVALNVLEHGVDLLRVLRLFTLDLLQTLLLRVDLRLQSAGAIRLLGHLHAQARDAVGAVLQVRAHDGRSALTLGGGTLRLGDLLARALGLQILLAHFLRDVFRRRIELLKLALRAGKVFLRGLIVVVHGLGLRVQPVERLHPDGDLGALELVAQVQIFLRRLGLLAQRLDLQLQLIDLVVDAQKVFLRAGKLALRFLLAVAVARDAGRLLKDLAALVALAGDDLCNAPLPDDRVTVATETGVHKQLVDVAQAAGFAVDGIFTLTAAVIAAGDHDLGVFGVEDAGAVIENERYLRKAHGAAFFRAAEDDVLHLAAAQRLRALLAHDPQDGVRYVRLAAPVRTDDRRDLLVKIQARLVRKGLEALDLQCF